MHPSRSRKHHPLATAGAALEHFVLRHFGFHPAPSGTEEPSRPAPKRA